MLSTILFELLIECLLKTVMSHNHRELEPSSEDTIECLFYTSLLSDRKSLEQLCKNINTVITTLTNEYIWHRDEFRVFLPILEKNIEDFPAHLTSRTCFGDNIEDEWYIVHIILELTKQFTDLVVQVKDSDGDILLIESADYLPKWANPDSTDNRVFIYKNHIHIIPPDLTSVEYLKVSDALQIILENQEQTLAIPEVQNAILNRIGKYPEKHKQNTHNAIVRLPLEIAALLKLQPRFIAPIVNAYCHHSVKDIKAYKIPDNQKDVAVTVKFTKCLYAMLLHSKNINYLSATDKNKSIGLGKKITCGFRIIMNRSKNIYSSQDYQKFLKSLTNNGYFRGNIEGSRDYKQLLEEANSFFTLAESPVMSNAASKISEITTSDEYLKTIDEIQTLTVPFLLEDDEDWLNIHPDQLNTMLNSRYGKKKLFENTDIITPQSISTQLTEFFKKTSDYEGIESGEKEQSNDEQLIEFDSEQFVNCIDKMLKLLSTGEEQEVDPDVSDDELAASDDDELEQELKASLQGMDANLKDNKTILQNMMSSIREEQGSSGPSSNLMNSLGHSKTDFLDSDDD